MNRRKFLLLASATAPLVIARPALAGVALPRATNVQVRLGEFVNYATRDPIAEGETVPHHTLTRAIIEIRCDPVPFSVVSLEHRFHVEGDTAPRLHVDYRTQHPEQIIQRGWHKMGIWFDTHPGLNLAHAEADGVAVEWTWRGLIT